MKILFREFVDQFFASESATSDHQLRVAAIGVLVFLAMPGFFLSVQLSGPFEYAALRFPAMLEPLIRLVATLFITFGIVAMGVIAAFTWDSLGFDRRDAMVLGPLPVRGATIISAKLAALAALLLAGAAIVNVMTAVPFSMVASNHTGFVPLVRHFVAHMIATMCAATFVFCLLVTTRALVGMVGGSRREAITSIVQFVLVSAVLSFLVIAPTGLDVQRGRRGAGRIVMAQIPAWSPTNWFLGLYEVIRTGSAELRPSALIAIEVTLASILIVVVATIAGYRRQLQLALAPSASAASRGSARFRRALARLIVGPNPVSRATADFIVATVVRSRPQQVPVALNAAIGLAMVVAGLVHRSGGMTGLFRPRTVVLWIPLILAYWATIGLRASFFVPSELPASWTFLANAPSRSRAYWSAVRASIVALLVPPVLMVTVALTPLVGWYVVRWHALVVTAILVLLAEVIALTINFVPFTRAYPPGHAKLKSLWPLYLLGIFAVAVWPVRIELRLLNDSASLVRMVEWIGATALVLELIGRWRALKWEMTPPEEVPDGLSTITVLSLAGAVRQA